MRFVITRLRCRPLQPTSTYIRAAMAELLEQSQLCQRPIRSALQAKVDCCPIRERDQYLKRLEHLLHWVASWHLFQLVTDSVGCSDFLATLTCVGLLFFWLLWPRRTTVDTAELNNP